MEQRARVGVAHLGPERRRENVRRVREITDEARIDVVGPPLRALIRAFLPHEKAPLQRQWRMIAATS